MIKIITYAKAGYMYRFVVTQASLCLHMQINWNGLDLEAGTCCWGSDVSRKGCRQAQLDATNIQSHKRELYSAEHTTLAQTGLYAYYSFITLYI